MALPSTIQAALARCEVKKQYGNFIGGKFIAPVRGQYFDNVSPVSGQVICSVARSTSEDVEKARAAAPHRGPLP